MLLTPLTLFSRSTPPVLPQKRAGLPELAMEHDITRYKKNMQELSYQAWAKQPSRRKKVLSVDKRVRDTPTLTVRSLTRTYEELVGVANQ